ncbi:ComEA family DNA-binding protein [Canibacter sp. lx-72]|uniref:ComEA family DNA-binding protein n=1 Tax=Canibacter zhuwentaonis TaxID=2837491 RepID=UPI001BDCF6DF|nr:ComEA family DNA-binding protein [Canibacter zhuwentaonis]MBT1017906.1 ComEA family DNA-binding protein [Canibacter zhuwentaonis]MBT1035068.1 ComEA family DNA-binding protein [Canibacter zhuwentaonis]
MARSKKSIIPPLADLAAPDANPKLSSLEAAHGARWDLQDHLLAYREGTIGQYQGGQPRFGDTGGIAGFNSDGGMAASTQPRFDSTGELVGARCRFNGTSEVTASTSAKRQNTVPDDVVDYQLAQALYGADAEAVLAPEITVTDRIKKALKTPVGAALAFAAVIALAVCVWLLWEAQALGSLAGDNKTALSATAEFTSLGELKTDSATDTAQDTLNQTSPSQKLVVHVIGAVNKPGLYELPVNSRVSDAITLAGGATDSAELAKINIARPLVDGEQIRVLARGEDTTPVAELDGSKLQDGAAAKGVSLNTASAEELQTLPKIGAKTAAKIVAWRNSHGGFKRVEQLLEVAGIGEKVFANLKPMLRL